MGQVISAHEIEKYLRPLRAQNKIVFTNGCFDILHRGHLEYLREAKSLGSLLFVGVNSDASVQRLKGPKRPVQSEGDRAELLAGLVPVDFVCLFTEDTPENLIHEVKPNVLVKGGDWSIDKIVGAPFVQSYGGKVQSLKFVEGKSTTSVIDRILQGYRS